MQLPMQGKHLSYVVAQIFKRGYNTAATHAPSHDVEWLSRELLYPGKDICQWKMFFVLKLQNEKI